MSQIESSAFFVGLVLAWATASGEAAWAGAPDDQALAARIAVAIKPVSRVLEERPYLLPPLSGAEEAVRVDVRFDGAGLRILQASAADGTIEDLSRVLAGRRTEPPDYWIFVLAPAATQVLYWAPLDDPRPGLVETIDHRGESGRPAKGHRIKAHPLDRTTAVTSVRVPFVPGGRIAIVASASHYTLDVATIGSVLHLTPEGCGCPPATLVAGDRSDPTRVNVVFVADGFTQADLGYFPCAVRELLDAILEDALLRNFSCAFNFWRLDVESPESGIDTSLCSAPSQCSAIPFQGGGIPACSVPTLPPRTLLAWNYPLQLCQPLPRSFHTKHCQLGSCDYVWPDPIDRQEAHNLADLCIPGGADFVMIVANSTTRGGGGFPGENNAVTTLWGLGDGSIENLAVHELGHALGLLDEYVGGVKDTFWAANRNVFRCDDIVGGSGCGSPPWESLCSNPLSSPCTPERFMDCQVVPSNCSGAPALDVGLYEGGYYAAQDYYHASNSCRMESMDPEFCAACRQWVDQVILVDHENLCSWQIDFPRTFSTRGNLWLPDLCEATLSGKGVLHALVEHDGVVGEVFVRSLFAEVTRESGKPKSAKLALNRGRGAQGGDWIWSDGKLPFPRSEWNCGKLRNLALRGATLVDDVRGMKWTPRELRWQKESAPPRPNPSKVSPGKRE